MSINARMCEIESDTQHLTEDTIKSVLGSQNCIDKYVYILHDKDTKEDGTLKNPHYHVYLHFTGGRTFDNVAKWFGLSPAFVSKIHGTFGDAVEYATHHNAPEKYQYDYSEVKANFDYEKAVKQNTERKEKKCSINQILSDIDSGTIKEYNIIDRITINDYVTYERQIKRAFDFKLKQAERAVNRNMRVCYIYGGSGTGKTTYAKMIAKQQNYEVFISSGSNDPFDGYKGQECVILDDLRGSVFPLSDLLKILDNNTSSTVKSRYKNVSLQCELLIITTTKTPAEFYKTVFESNGEEYKQFLRRCTEMARVTEDKVYLYAYNYKTCKHEYMATINNPVKDLQALIAFDKEKTTKNLLALFEIGKQGLDSMAEAFTNRPDLFKFDDKKTDTKEIQDKELKELIELFGDENLTEIYNPDTDEN